MRIAFYAPLKAPDHPTPSGDRLMARLLLAALRRAGHEVEVVSDLRAFTRTPDEAALVALRQAAASERARLSELWGRSGAPDLWFCYHPYYKAPDLLAAPLARRFGLPVVTAEASLSRRRATGPWAPFQAEVADLVALAAVNLCFTGRDRDGLLGIVPSARCAALPPFIDVEAWLSLAAGAAGRNPARDGGPVELACVAMMRPGDKSASFAMLAAALARLPDRDWRLTIIGDGPERAPVEAMFAALPPDRLRWLGELPPARVAAELGRASLLVWPGTGEAYGLAYLEAQALGVPVVAQATAGVPEVVRDGLTGLLTPEGDVDAYAAAIARLIDHSDERDAMAARARVFVRDERSLERAARILAEAVGMAMGEGTR